MSNDLILWCFSFWYSLAFLIITATTTFPSSSAASTADVLIIRHGRSRVRHSTEKDHIRWGLKAFDNLTLDYSDFDNANDTTDFYLNNSSIESNSSEYVTPAANQLRTVKLTTTPSITTTTSTSSAITTPTILTATNEKSVGIIHDVVEQTNDEFDDKKKFGDDKAATTIREATVTKPTKGILSNDKRLSSTIPNSKKKFGKRKIMENIKKNVDKGLEYLKAHFDLDESNQIDIVNQQSNGASNARQHVAVNPVGIEINNNVDDNINKNKNSFNENSDGDNQNTKNNENQLNGKRQNRKSSKNAENLKSFKINLAISKTTRQQQTTEQQQQQPLYISHFVKSTQNNEKDDKNLFSDYQSDFVFDINNGNDWTHPRNNDDNSKKGPTINANKKNEEAKDDLNIVKQHDKKVLFSRGDVNLTEKEYNANHGNSRNQENDNNNNNNNNNEEAAINNGTDDSKNPDKTRDNDNSDTIKSQLPLLSFSSSKDNANDIDGNNINPNHNHNNNQNKPQLNHSNHKSHQIEIKLNPSSSFSSDEEVELFPSDYESSNNDNGHIYANFDNKNNHNNEQQFSSDDDYVNNVPSVNTIDLNYMDDGNGDSVVGVENVANNNIYQMPEVDLSSFDETTRNNRRNLMRGRDLVTKFLQIVESQHLLGANCSAGTELNLGEGVVDHYAQDRFRVEAEVAVNRANMLSRIFKLTSPEVQVSEELLHASVLSMIEFDDDIFGAGNCFDWNQHPSKQGLFCPFAYRLPASEQGAILVKDLAAEYHYLGNKSEWFFVPRKNAEKVIMRNEQYIKSYHIFSNSTQREGDEILSVKYEDGRWSKPYYDCGGGNIWMLTYTVPFFGYDNGTYFFKGTSGIDIDLRRVDIDQCPQRNLPVGTRQPLNIFAGTDKCKQQTTECSPSPGLGFRRGSYRCICRRGFYFPDTSIEQKYFNGSTLEEEYEKLMLGEESFYNHIDAYECLQCAEGCDTCEDASPCVAELNWPMRTSVLILACAVIGFLPPAALFTHKYQQVKVVRAASPVLLRVIALGAFFIYCTSIVMYPNPSLYTCTARIWLREIGFSLTYGALMLKTWRISVIFRIRSAKAVKITDGSLLKRLGILCGFVGVALLVRTLVAPPVVIVGRTADNLKAFLCKTDWWDHTFTSMEVLFLGWGVRLCIMVRKAPSEFNESRFISMAIYNEFLLTCFLNVSMLFLQSPANPDLLYIIFFCHTQLTVTLLLALIFGSKVYLVFRGGGKPHEEPMKPSGAKFVSRSQPRTFANASSTSTAQMGVHVGNNDSRLTEQEALEEIKQICDQLKRLYERIPSRGSAQGTIQALLASCKMSTSTQLMLKPPPPGGGSGGGASPKLNSFIDKSTNTNFTDNDFTNNITTINHLCAKIMITDESDKQLHCNNNYSSNHINLVEADLTTHCHKSNGAAHVFIVETETNGGVVNNRTADDDHHRCGCCCGSKKGGDHCPHQTTTKRFDGCDSKISEVDKITGCDYNQIKCNIKCSSTCLTNNICKNNNNNNNSTSCNNKPTGGILNDKIDLQLATIKGNDSENSSIGQNNSNLNLNELEFECMCSSSCDEDVYNDFKDNCDIALDPRELRSALSDLRKSQNTNLNYSTNFNSNKYSSDFRIRGTSGYSNRRQPNFESCDNIYYGNSSSSYQKVVYNNQFMNKYLSTSNVEAGNSLYTSASTSQITSNVLPLSNRTARSHLPDQQNLRTSKSEESALVLGESIMHIPPPTTRMGSFKSPAAHTAPIASKDLETLSNQIIAKNLRDHGVADLSKTLKLKPSTSEPTTSSARVLSKSEEQLEMAKRKKSPEKRLVIDLNDRSKYTEEVSV